MISPLWLGHSCTLIYTDRLVAIVYCSVVWLLYFLCWSFLPITPIWPHLVCNLDHLFMGYSLFWSLILLCLYLSYQLWSFTILYGTDFTSIISFLPSSSFFKSQVHNSKCDKFKAIAGHQSWRTLMDNDLRITETVVYLYTYSTGNHVMNVGW